MASLAIALTCVFARWGLIDGQLVKRQPIDLEVYLSAGQAVWHGESVYAAKFVVSGDQLPFTYPPFAALLFALLAWLPLAMADVLVMTATVCCGIAIAYWLSEDHAAPELPFGVMAALVLCTQPSFATLSFGQINMLLTALVLADALDRRPSWLPRGALIGCAAAIKVTPAVFIVWFLARRDTRGLMTMLISAGSVTALSAAILPHDTWTYFTSALFATERVGETTNLHNAAMHGVIARAGLDVALWLLCSSMALVLCFLAAGRAHERGYEVFSLAIVAGLGLIVSPISWTHHFTWLPILALAGLRSGLPVALSWWAGLSTTVGMLGTAPGVAAALQRWAVAQYSVLIWAFVIGFLLLTSRNVSCSRLDIITRFRARSKCSFR